MESIQLSKHFDTHLSRTSKGVESSSSEIQNGVDPILQW